MPDEHSAHSTFSVPLSCLPHLLEHQAKRIPGAPAILALGRAPLTYGCLYQQVDKVGHALRAMGIGRHDRVAIVLPNFSRNRDLLPVLSLAIPVVVAGTLVGILLWGKNDDAKFRYSVLSLLLISGLVLIH